MKYIVLGGSGFVGRIIARALLNVTTNVVAYSSKEFNLLDESTFSKLHIDDKTIIIDCAASVNNSEDDPLNTNVRGLRNFINYLRNTQVPHTYVYISTVATIYPELVKENKYVESKFIAEALIREHIPSYKIIRLIFPFGKGENSKRLISGLINKLKNNQKIVVTPLYLNLTPAQSLYNNFVRIISAAKTEMNISINHTYYLPGIAEYMKNKMNSESSIEVAGIENKLTVNSDIELHCNYNDVYMAIDEMLQ